MGQESKNISAFNYGDIITRIEPARITQPYYNENLNMEIEIVMRVDSSYRGEPMEFIGIINNIIYLKRIRQPFIGKYTELEIERWSDGWGRYIDPEQLINCRLISIKKM